MVFLRTSLNRIRFLHLLLLVTGSFKCNPDRYFWFFKSAIFFKEPLLYLVTAARLDVTCFPVYFLLFNSMIFKSVDEICRDQGRISLA